MRRSQLDNDVYLLKVCNDLYSVLFVSRFMKWINCFATKTWQWCPLKFEVKVGLDLSGRNVLEVVFLSMCNHYSSISGWGDVLGSSNRRRLNWGLPDALLRAENSERVNISGNFGPLKILQVQFGFKLHEITMILESYAFVNVYCRLKLGECLWRLETDKTLANSKFVF